MTKNNLHLQLQVISGDTLSSQTRDEVVGLCSRAFEEDLGPLLDTFHGAVHVLGRLGPKLVTHALWVTRWLQAGTQPLMRTAYVEGVATEEAYRNRGFATAVMKRVAAEVQDFDLAALATGSVAYYERFGWELWRGPLFIRTDEGTDKGTNEGTDPDLLPCPEDEGAVMILRLPRTPSLDLAAPLSAEWRAGELW